MRDLLKYLLLTTLIIFSIVACETNFEDVGVNLIDSNTFDTERADFEVSTYTKNVTRSRVENRPLNGLGIYKTNNFGIIRGGVATQLAVPPTVDFGDSPTIDAVVLDLPYDSTSDGVDDEGKPQFILNNIYGDQDIEYTIRISRLNTFLNALDPEDPTRPKTYYSDKVYNKLEELYAGNFKPNANDTVLYVRRMDFDTDDQENFDTIKKADLSPSIKFELDKEFFRTNFVENPDTQNFESQERFIQFFNGLLFEVEGNDGSMMMLNFFPATVTIYYSNNILTDETVGDNQQDLNGDGDFDDVDVPIRTKQILTLTFNGIRTSTFDRDYNGSLAEPTLDNPADNEKLYVQGAAGSLAVLDAFSGIDLATIRAENWLINEANLVFNIDQDASGEDVPTRLFLYKLDEDNDDENENIQILDIITEGESILDGNLQNEEDDGDDETTEGPLKYRFRITDYVSEVLKNEDPVNPVTLGVKAFHASDLPNRNIPGDTIVSDFSWDPRGVVLFGNGIVPTDPDFDKRVKLEIFYTKLNE